jgi:hypothetical protein
VSNGYLAGYGAGEEKRSSLIRRVLAWTVSALLISGVLWFAFRNYPARAKLDSFIELLQAKEYQKAYALWGCTQAAPCRDYNFERFLRDWGPESPAANAQSATLVSKATCGGLLLNSAVLRVYRFQPDHIVNLWVDRSDGHVSFAPVIGKKQCTVLP